jgi:hypothetical protein
MNRRSFMLATALFGASSIARSEAKPKLIVLGAEITSPIRSVNPSARKRERSVGSWLVCNGAEADRSTASAAIINAPLLT